MTNKKPDPKAENSINTNIESDKNQLSDFLLVELASMQQRIKEIYYSTGLVDIDARGVHLTADEFLKAFPEHGTEVLQEQPRKCRLSVMYKNTEFFCQTRCE